MVPCVVVDDMTGLLTLIDHYFIYLCHRSKIERDFTPREINEYYSKKWFWERYCKPKRQQLKVISKQYKPLFGASNTPSQTNQHSLKPNSTRHGTNTPNSPLFLMLLSCPNLKLKRLYGNDIIAWILLANLKKRLAFGHKIPHQTACFKRNASGSIGRLCPSENGYGPCIYIVSIPLSPFCGWYSTESFFLYLLQQ